VIFILLQIDVGGIIKNTRKRKYQDGLITFEFTLVVIKGEEKPQLRCEVLENESCKVNKLM
jgi:hypothetical protein